MRSLYPWSFFPSNLSPAAIRSIALQFTINEIASSLSLMHQIEKKASSIIQAERWPKEIGTLLKELDQIMLVTLSDPFGQKGGSLDKLAFFAIKMGTPSPDISLLSKAESILLSAREQLSIWRGRPFPERPQVLLAIEHLSQTFKRLIEEFLFSLLGALEEARFDENVLFALVEKREEINQATQDATVEKVFIKLYPSGPSHLKAILHEGYSRRGFADFYTKNIVLIDSIDWEIESLSLS